MIYAEYINVNVDGVYVHNIGNKLSDEGVSMSNAPLLISDNERAFLLNRMLSQMHKEEAKFQLHHGVDLSLNIVYNAVQKLFNDSYDLRGASWNISRHLYDSSCHPRCAGGDVYFAYLKDTVLDGETCDALAIFKSAPKVFSMDVTSDGDGQVFNMVRSVFEFESGAIIFNTESETGYRVTAFDNSKAKMLWTSEFLMLQEVDSEKTYTRNLVNLTRGYIEDVISERFEVSPVEKSLLLNKLRTTLENSDNYDTEEFENAVFEQPEVIDHYKEYRQTYNKASGKQLPEQFTFDADVVKKAAKKIARRLRLDGNFYIYINTDDGKLIEQGVDGDSGMNFVKLFYKNERAQ